MACRGIHLNLGNSANLKRAGSYLYGIRWSVICWNAVVLSYTLHMFLCGLIAIYSLWNVYFVSCSFNPSQIPVKLFLKILALTSSLEFLCDILFAEMVSASYDRIGSSRYGSKYIAIITNSTQVSRNSFSSQWLTKQPYEGKPPQWH